MIQQNNVDLARIEGQSFVIGREGRIYIHDESISRRHAMLSVIGGKVYLEDLGSSNGTFLIRKRNLHEPDGRPVSPLQTVLIGECRFRVFDLLSIACKLYGNDNTSFTTRVKPRTIDIAV